MASRDDNFRNFMTNKSRSDGKALTVVPVSSAAMQVVLRAGCLFALTIAFLYATYVAMQKLISGEMMVVWSREEVDHFQYPTLGICPGLASPTISTFKEALTQPDTVNFTTVKQYDLDVLQESQQNASLISSFILEIQGMPLHGRLVKLPLPGKVGTNDSVVLGLNIPKSLIGAVYYISVNFGDSFTPSVKLLYGGDFSVINIKDNGNGTINRQVGFELQRTITIYINTETHPCYEDGEGEGVYTCMNRYIESQLKCKLPWTIESGGNASEVCSTEAQFSHYREIVRTYQTAKESEIHRDMGCKPMCKSEELQIIPRWDINYPKAVNYPIALEDLTIVFQFRKTTVERQEQVYTYGRSAFIADIGGYIGLFLGFSCFTIYELLSCAFIKFCGSKQQQQQQSNRRKNKLGEIGFMNPQLGFGYSSKDPRN